MKRVIRERARRSDRMPLAHPLGRPEHLLRGPRRRIPAADRRSAWENATPCDVPSVELGHHGSGARSIAFIERFELDDPGLLELPPIVREADRDDRDLAPESAGLYVVCCACDAGVPVAADADTGRVVTEAPCIIAYSRSLRRTRA
jgi:hypothetical protein